MKHRIYLVFFLSIFLIQTGLAQQPGEISYNDSQVMPESMVGKRIQSVIDTINSGNPERIRQLITNECAGSFRDSTPMDTHIATLQRLLHNTGGLDFYSIRTYVPERKNDTIVIFRDRILQDWRAIVFNFGDAPDYLITGIQISNARPPRDYKDLDNASINVEEFLKRIKEIVAKLTENDVFSGTILIAKGDKVLWNSAAGEASKAFHIPNNIDTKLNLGSMNKMFTSIAIMQLVEKGRLSLDDTIDKYLDESWLPKEVTSRITVRHLLSHSSGLGSYFNDVYIKSSRLLFKKLDDYKILIKDDRPAFESGTKFQYSNTGMFLLGVIIEKVTGENYFDYIRKTIYEPAGMTNSDCYEIDYPVENLAIGYSPDFTSPYHWQNNIYKHVVKGGPAGGGFSTVKDLHKYALALIGGKYLSKKSMEEMWTDRLQANYGYGFSVTDSPAGKIVGHSGGFDGINSNLDIYLDSGFIVAVMSNYDNGASPLVRKTRELIARIK